MITHDYQRLTMIVNKYPRLLKNIINVFVKDVLKGMLVEYIWYIAGTKSMIVP